MKLLCSELQWLPISSRVNAKVLMMRVWLCAICPLLPLRLTALLSLLPSLLSRPISSSQTLGHSRLPPAQGPCAGCSSCQKGPPKYPRASLRSTQLTPAPLLKRPSLKMIYEPLLHFQFYLPSSILSDAHQVLTYIYLVAYCLSPPTIKLHKGRDFSCLSCSIRGTQSTLAEYQLFVESTLASHLGDLV